MDHYSNQKNLQNSWKKDSTITGLPHYTHKQMEK